MPRKKQTASPSTRKTRQSHRGKEVLQDGIPEVYEDMLAEVVASSSTFATPSRSVKRRKLAEEPEANDLDNELFEYEANDMRDTDVSHNPQVIYDDFEGSDESDVEFEDVELEPIADQEQDDETIEQKPLQLDLSKPATPSRTVQRRKPVSHAERKIRLDVHKWHLLSLLLHLQCRNKWCDSEEVHGFLKPLISRKTIALLHVDESKPQYQISHSFTKGIEEICTFWRQEWEINARGMRRAYWKDEVDARKESDEAEDPIDFDDFKLAAKTRSGSRDLGAQLFCALLRSLAVETRLVCSLQVLPFSGVAKGQTPEKPKPNLIYAPAQNYGSSTQKRASSARKRISESPHPVFWVEVLSPATTTWIPLDPIVRSTINKPRTGFEPPASDSLNNMSYVIAFEEDGSAKDVTRRYTQWYNAKTRKVRVENTKGGEEWWGRTMNFFEKPLDDIRDDIEDADLTKRSASEGMPRSVQDFKGHPIYVLERHLRMNEVIFPRREVGKVTTGASKNASLESVFRRADVHLCRTSDAWYRRGRDVKAGETPLKHVMPKRGKEVRADSEEEEDDQDGVALYAEYQTSIYEPPPVVDGNIPRNAYGNLDVYVPSMIPAGAIHVRHPLAAKAAKLMDLNYADAVTGFNFKGRQGTAVVDGVVVRADARLAMIVLIRGLESQAMDELEAERAKFVLGIWKRWLKALQIRERVEQQYGERESSDHPMRDQGDEEEEEDETYRDDDDEDFGGGFMPEAIEHEATTPKREPEPELQNLKPIPALFPTEPLRHEIIIVNSSHKPPEPKHQLSTIKKADRDTDFEEEGGGFMVEEDEKIHSPKHHTAYNHDEADSEVEGGGFLLDEEEAESPTHTTQLQTAEEPSSPPAIPIDEAEPNRMEVDPAGQEASIQADVPMASSQKTNEPPPLSTQASKSSYSRDTDATSLLSHDPDDDDAEPEWLIESLGEG